MLESKNFPQNLPVSIFSVVSLVFPLDLSDECRVKCKIWVKIQKKAKEEEEKNVSQDLSKRLLNDIRSHS